MEASRFQRPVAPPIYSLTMFAKALLLSLTHRPEPKALLAMPDLAVSRSPESRHQSDPLNRLD